MPEFSITKILFYSSHFPSPYWVLYPGNVVGSQKKVLHLDHLAKKSSIYPDPTRSRRKNTVFVPKNTIFTPLSAKSSLINIENIAGSLGDNYCLLWNKETVEAPANGLNVYLYRGRRAFLFGGMAATPHFP